MAQPALDLGGAQLVVAVALLLGDLGQLPAGAARRRIGPHHPQHPRQMRAIDISDFNPPVAIQIGNARNGQPAVALANGGGGRHGLGMGLCGIGLGINLDAGACGKIGHHCHQLGAVVAIQIGQAGVGIFENATACAQNLPGAGAPDNFQRAIFAPRHSAMAIGIGRFDIARGADLWGGLRQRLGRYGPGQGRKGQRHTGNEPHKGAAECHFCRALARLRQRPLHQICFSGICTTSPSSASLTFSWQVKRERWGSG